MALDKQNISIPFAQGIDTKVDPRQLQPGKLQVLQNAVFDENLLLTKRNGYKSLTGSTYAASSGVGLATYKDELVSFDNNNLYSFNPENSTQVQKGPITHLDISTQSIYRSSTSQTLPNSAYNQNGKLFLYTWTDSSAGVSFSVVSEETGLQITSGSIDSKYINPIPFSIGNYLILAVGDNSTSPHTLRYFFFPILNPVISGPNTISTSLNTANPRFNGYVLDNKLYISWYSSDPGMRTTIIDSTLTQLVQTIMAGENGSTNIFLMTNLPPFESSAVQQAIWTVYYDGTNLKYFIQNKINLTTITGPTLIINTSAVFVNLAGYAQNKQGFIFAQVQSTYSYSSVRSDRIDTFSARYEGTTSSLSSFLFGASLFSNVIYYNGKAYVVIAYGPANGQGFEPTYFIVQINNPSGVTLTPVIVGKIAYTNGGGYSSKLSNINQITTNKFQFAYLIKDLLEASQDALNNVYTQTGVNSATFDFDAFNKFQCIDMGGSLNINGGLGWMYDGLNVVENNFNLFPEDCGATSGSSGAGLFPGTYSYATTYEWTDNQGNIHRSAPSPIFSTTIGSTAFLNIQIPNLRLTQKTNVAIGIYRTAPSINVGTFYKVSSITNPPLSSTSADSTSFIDNKSDAAIIGNQLLYTTGGVVENSGAPTSPAMTLFKNRLIMVDGENRNQFWFSKQTLQNTPVEMSDFFTQFVDPRFGDITALSVMDDKLIIFKENAVFYIAGEGPDSTGSNNDFSEAVFITSVVGTVNQKSIVLIDQGLMFQSNKGIYLLDRSLRVSFIGSDVDAFSENAITSALLIPQTRQVRLTLDNGICLLYDYYVGQWGTFTGISAAAAVVFEGLHTYIMPGGNTFILQETPGIYSDNGKPILMNLTTAWLSMSGLQGFQRAYRLYFLGQYVSPHALNVSVAYDFNPNPAQTAQILMQQNPSYGGDPYFGAGYVFGGAGTTEQYRINLTRQKCQSVQISIQESLDTTNYVLGGGVKLEAIGALIGRKLSYPKLPASKSVS